MRTVHDHYLPPDREAFVAAEPPTGRVIVIAPTRAACETIELAVQLHLETFLEKMHGDEVRQLAREGAGFGIVAGTGTGKTLAIRLIAEEILGTTALKVGVVNREREATPETPTWNVIIVTTGIARRWFQDGDIQAHDTLVVDEIHQTSAELELCLALGKKVGCRFIWLSATVDPTFYKQYLGSRAVVESYAFDPNKAARVKVIDEEPIRFLSDKFLQGVMKERRGVALFVPTRAGVEEAAAHVRERYPRINSAFYHGGEPIRIIRPFLEGEEQKPFFLAMTAAGQSALNVRGLDTVIILDKRFTNVVDKGRNVLTQMHLGANEILQMAGRVHGRVEGGRVFILSDREIQFQALAPTAPEFQLAGDSERVAMTCADIGVDVGELELPVPLDRIAYRKAVELLRGRGIIDERGRLSSYGKMVEAMPVDRAWAELLVQSDDELIPYVAVMSSVESLHRMCREERNLDGLIVPGSDHLTAYNVYAEAYARAGYLGDVYGLPRHLFDEEKIQEWAEERGVLVKAIEDIALGMASVFRALEVPLPTRMSNAGEGIYRRYAELLAQFMPFSLVIDEELPDGQEARVSRSSVCGSWGAITGELRFFADRFGNPRASIEGTQIPADLIRRYATKSAPEIAYDPRKRQGSLVLRTRVEYFGFELERDVEVLDEIPADMVPQARAAIADALARGEARHPAMKRMLPAIEEVREVWRRTGGRTKKLGHKELSAEFARQLEQAGLMRMSDFRSVPLEIDRRQYFSAADHEAAMALPHWVEVRDRPVEIDYDVEEKEQGPVGVARLVLPEKLARTLVESELPDLGRPLRFVVARGPRGTVRAGALDELQDLLARPWSPDEVRVAERNEGDRRRGPRDDSRYGNDQHLSAEERAARAIAADIEKHQRERAARAQEKKRNRNQAARGARPGDDRRGKPGKHTRHVTSAKGRSGKRGKRR